MKPGKYSDSGYRYIENQYRVSNSILPIPNLFTKTDYTKTFYDFETYNVDTLDVSENYDRIADLYFRMHEDLTLHTKIDYTLYNLLEDLGGISELLVKTAAFIFGGFLSFNASLIMIDSMYSHKC